MRCVFFFQLYSVLDVSHIEEHLMRVWLYQSAHVSPVLTQLWDHVTACQMLICSQYIF